MSVVNETYKSSYTGRGDTGPYAVTFPVILDDGGNATDIVVKLIDAAGAETDITSVCTVTGMNVYTTASYSSAYQVVVLRYPSLTQPYTFPYRTKFPSQRFEDALDRLLFLIQREDLENAQSLKIPIGEEETDRIPDAASRANKYLAFDADGQPIVSGGAAGAYPVTAFMATVLAAVAAGDALTLLGLSAFVQTLMDDASASAVLTTLGVSTFAKTLLDDAAAANALTTLGVSSFIQTLVDDADAAAARATLNAGGAAPLVKVLDIGDWNMDSTATINVAHGLTLAKIRAVYVTIRDDADTSYFTLEYNNGTEVYGHYLLSSSNVGLTREASSPFDSANFDATSFNRGWIIIWYVP